MQEHFGVIELALVFGVALALAVWELVRIRREVRKDRAERRDTDE